MNVPHSDALVFFGATGDLAYKKIFPSLQAMIKRGNLDVPVIGVAKAGWGVDQLRARARESIEKHGGGLDPMVFDPRDTHGLKSAVPDVQRDFHDCDAPRQLALQFLFGGYDYLGALQFLLQPEGIALNCEIQVADGEAADNVTDGAAREVEIHAGGAGDVLYQADTLELIRGQPDFHRVNVISHSLSSGCQASVAVAIRGAIAPRGGPDLPNFPQDFHNLGPHTLGPLATRMQVA